MHKFVLFRLLLLPLQVEVQIVEDMLRCLNVRCSKMNFNWTKELLKGFVTSLYRTRL
jgi:hypothetical protein